jgi:hypothetical protein
VRGRAILPRILQYELIELYPSLQLKFVEDCPPYNAAGIFGVIISRQSDATVSSLC